MGRPEQQKQYTADDYFALEAQSEVRHEFFEGEIFAMAGASIAHNTIVGNFYIMLRQSLRGKNCRVQLEAVRLAVEEGRHYTYPDVMVSCDPADQRESQQLRNPVLIVEVLSPSTEAYDRGLKFNQYKKLPSLRHYLLVSQTTWLVEWYQLTEHRAWAHTALAEAEDTLAIPELGLTMTLADVYEEAGVAPLKLNFGSEGQ
ncbi:Uma2 family endonuclease [Hymenobacter ginsengisoli]|uniref:Uma2 family endonuclease n=1 Tax=Hymenobacter ginsengisoli TaxID=1051626 RepID=A0ABP8QRB4_9BACT|nr:MULTISPECIES: Uma2 family endonuclease [unclassified Hymenobacter]MBO2032936.1 Uma2 family endonuclease [Hymenobacter sp. BT559]